MSIRKLDQAWKTECATHTLKLVLLALADNASDEGFCWPSINTIAEKCDLSRVAVLTQIKLLESAGLIKVRRGSGRSNNQYLVLVEEENWPDGGRSSGKRGLPVVVNGVDQCGKRGLPVVVNGVNPNHHITVREPSEKPSADTGVPSEHKEFIRLWGEAYEEVFGWKYVFIGGKDGAAVKRLLSASGKSASELVDTAKRAWKAFGEGFWNCANQSGTISKFASAYNEIERELKQRGKESNRLTEEELHAQGW